MRQQLHSDIDLTGQHEVHSTKGKGKSRVPCSQWSSSSCWGVSCPHGLKRQDGNVLSCRPVQFSFLMMCLISCQYYCSYICLTILLFFPTSITKLPFSQPYIKAAEKPVRNGFLLITFYKCFKNRLEGGWLTVEWLIYRLCAAFGLPETRCFAL